MTSACHKMISRYLHFQLNVLLAQKDTTANMSILTSSFLLNFRAFRPGVDKLSDDDKTNILKIVDGRPAELRVR